MNIKTILLCIVYIYRERMETELELFTQSLDDRNLSQGTINTYIKLYNKLYTEVNDDLHNLSQSKMLETLIDMEIESVNTYNSLLNIFILIRKLYKLNTDELTTKRDNINSLFILTAFLLNEVRVKELFFDTPMP